MPPPSLVSVLSHLRRSAADAAGLDDATLLSRFAKERDQAAFELLVWRHGAMILGVCRRRVRDLHAAEDAFQATFMALARRAGSIRRGTSVAAWLYCVAGRIALAADIRNARLRTREQPLDGVENPGREPTPSDVASLRELRQTLDDAIHRLPARYREPLVLTCFAGRSHAEAARELGCAVRTIESRLGRARQRLRSVLLRRGLLPAGGLATVLAPTDAPARVAASRVLATVRVAVNGNASITIETLTQGALHAMLLSKIKVAVAVMFVAGFVGLGTGGWVYQSRAIGQAPTIQPPTVPSEAVMPPSPPQHNEKLQAVLSELAEALKKDSSPETTQKIQALLDAAADRRRWKQEKEIEAALASLGADIAKLELLVKGDKNRELSMVEFKSVFHNLKDTFDGRAAVKATGDNTKIDELKLHGKVTKVDGDLVIIGAGQDAGVAEGVVFHLFRPGEPPWYLGTVTILNATRAEAVGRVITKVNTKARVGDEMFSGFLIPRR